MEIGFESIVLAPEDLALLARLAVGEEITFYSSGTISASFTRLWQFGFVKLDMDESGTLIVDNYKSHASITPLGRSYYFYATHRAKKQREKTRTDWIRYSVTTLIALTALLISLLK